MLYVLHFKYFAFTSDKISNGASAYLHTVALDVLHFKYYVLSAMF